MACLNQTLHDGHFKLTKIDFIAMKIDMATDLLFFNLHDDDYLWIVKTTREINYAYVNFIERDFGM